MTRLAATLVLALVCLAGCGGSSPKPSPVTESSTSATPSPSGAPTMPAEAKGTTPEAAKAFVRHYMDLFTYSASTGDIQPMTDVSDPSCESCTQVIGLIQKVYGSGGYTKGRGYEAVDLKVIPATRAGTVRLRGLVTLYPQEYKADASASPTTSPQSSVKSVFTVTATATGWQMMTWERS